MSEIAELPLCRTTPDFSNEENLSAAALTCLFGMPEIAGRPYATNHSGSIQTRRYVILDFVLELLRCQTLAPDTPIPISG